VNRLTLYPAFWTSCQFCQHRIPAQAGVSVLSQLECRNQIQGHPGQDPQRSEVHRQGGEDVRVALTGVLAHVAIGCHQLHAGHRGGRADDDSACGAVDLHRRVEFRQVDVRARTVGEVAEAVPGAQRFHHRVFAYAAPHILDGAGP
jgi:hypothetical protein